jgi:hypothetical protein
LSANERRFDLHAQQGSGAAASVIGETAVPVANAHVTRGSSLANKLPVGVLDLNRLGVPIPGQPCGEVLGSIEQPDIAGFRGEQHELAEADNAFIVLGSPTLDVADLGADLCGEIPAER